MKNDTSQTQTTLPTPVPSSRKKGSTTSLLENTLRLQEAHAAKVAAGLDGNQMLYNTYRPTTLDQMVGQAAIIADVNEWFTLGIVPRFTIFYSEGIPGVGKDVLADIVARYILDIPSHLDPRKDVCNRYMVLNCKADGGIDAVRKALDTVRVPPTAMPGYTPRYVLNLTELQGVSEAAMDSLLSMVENPPQWLWVVATTTDLAKVLRTGTSKNAKGKGSSALRSRAVLKQLQPISPEDILQRLQLVATKEGILSSTIDVEVLSGIAMASAGSMRTALSILEEHRYQKSKDVIMKQLSVQLDEATFPVRQIAMALVYEHYTTQSGVDVNCKTYPSKYPIILHYVNACDSGEAGRAALISVIGSWLGISDTREPSPGMCKALGCTPGNWSKGDNPVGATLKASENFIRAIRLLELLTSAGIVEGALHEARARLLVILSNAAKQLSSGN